eukprot:1039164-Prymnesium_polylepis.1
MICSIEPSTSAVSVVAIVCRTIGCSEPKLTGPHSTCGRARAHRARRARVINSTRGRAALARAASGKTSRATR